MASLGDRRLVPALWAAFEKDIEPRGNCYGWDAPHEARRMLIALGHLGARRACTGARLSTLSDSLWCLGGEFGSEECLSRARLREIAGRPLGPNDPYWQRDCRRFEFPSRPSGAP
jgi:hypothetical protein